MAARLFYDEDQFTIPDLKIKVLRQYQEDFIEHYHAFDEIVIVVGGCATHYLDGNPTEIKRGDVFLVKPKQRHSYENTQQLEIINVLFGSTLLSEYDDELRRMPSFQTLFYVEPYSTIAVQSKKYLSLDDVSLKRIIELGEKITSELRLQQEGFRIAVRIIFLELVLELCRQKPSSSEYGPVHPYFQLGNAFSFIAENFAQPIGLVDFEREMSASRRTVNRIFKSLTGKSPIDYLIHYRISKAKELLETTNNSIIFVAQNCGFNDSAYFSKTFRKITGFSPRFFRQACLKDVVETANPAGRASQ